MRKRLDQLLIERKIAPTRERAQHLIRAGAIQLPWSRPANPGTLVEEGTPVVLRKKEFVGRGAQKLWSFLEKERLFFHQKVVLDVGASTGGFSQVALLRGAQRVYCVDVGKGQLHSSLRKDPRVVLRERVNFRLAERNLLPERVDTCLMDTSFISSTLLIPKVPLFLKKRGELILLVKPQFELPAPKVPGGRVRDPKAIAEAVALVSRELRQQGFSIVAESPSALPGKKGNREIFLFAELQ